MKDTLSEYDREHLSPATSHASEESATSHSSEEICVGPFADEEGIHEPLAMRLSPEGLKGFLASSYVKGVGDVFASKVADAAGLDILNPDFDFNRLAGAVPGLTDSKLEDIKESLSALRFPAEVGVLLYSAGLSNVEAEKILSHYGRKVAKALLEDPYDMVENVWKVSFFTADKLGRWLGVADNDPRRIRGALLTAVKFYAERGNMFATEQQALHTAAALTGTTEEEVRPQLEYLIREGRLVSSHGGIYLPVYYEAEQIGAEKLVNLIKRGQPVEDEYEIPTTDLSGNRLNEAQLEALRTVMNHPVTIVTGGPGTGKTTTVRGIISLFEDLGKKVVLAAPTGRAAKRMSTLAGAEAKTLHRLLGYSMGRGYRNKQFDADILVIDEASMLEQVMLRHLLDALTHNTKIVLVGDTNQLPSIGAGDVLNELIKSGTVPVVKLEENFRQAKGSGIASAAAAIKEGKELQEGDTEDFMVVYEDTEEKILQKVLRLVSEEIPKRFGVDAKDIQVVTPQQEGELGAKQLNADIQKWVNPSGPELKRGLKLFRVGDRVMQTSNSSEHGVYNGETGWVSAIEEEGMRMEVTFHDGKKQWYGKDRLKEITLAYATTVHKLQGSETDYMVLIISNSHRRMLYRNLLYTGVSRARKLCVLIGERKAIQTALENESPAIRNSNFQHSLRTHIGLIS